MNSSLAFSRLTMYNHLKTCPSLHSKPHYPWNSISLFSPSATNVLYDLWVHLFCVFRVNGVIQYVMTFCVWLLSLCFCVEVLPCCMSVLYSFLRLSNIPLCIYTNGITICLSIVCWWTFWFLWIMLLWTCMYMYLFKSVFSLLDTYLGME